MMNRKEFLILCAKLGIALPILPQALAGCSKDELTFEPFDVNFNGKVLVIGAGAAGNTADYLLDR